MTDDKDFQQMAVNLLGQAFSRHVPYAPGDDLVLDSADRLQLLLLLEQQPYIDVSRLDQIYLATEITSIDDLACLLQLVWEES